MIVLDRVKYDDSDEFYTQVALVKACVKSLMQGGYRFKGKTVFCPCDSDKSAFPNYLWDNQEKLGIKAVHCACRLNDGSGIFWDSRTNATKLDSYSFISPETLELYGKYDLVITNPPFSLLYGKGLSTITSACKECLFIAPESIFTTPACVWSNRVLYFNYATGEERWFVRPNGGKRELNITMASTLRFAGKSKGKPLRNCKGIFLPDKNCFVCKSRNDVPSDWNGLIMSSFCAPQILDMDYFKLVGAVKPKMKTVLCRRQDYARLVSEGVLQDGKCYYIIFRR